MEVKHGRQIPRALPKWWEQAQRNAPEGKLPLLVLHPLGADYQDSLAVVRLEDLSHPGQADEAEQTKMNVGLAATLCLRLLLALANWRMVMTGVLTTGASESELKARLDAWGSAARKQGNWTTL